MELDTINLGGIHVFYHYPTNEWFATTTAQLERAREIEDSDEESAITWFDAIRPATTIEVFEATRPNRARALSWVTPPSEQGQIVSDAFAGDREDWIYRLRTDQSDRSARIFRAPIADLVGEFAPWTTVPEIDGEWEEIDLEHPHGASPRGDR